MPRERRDRREERAKIGWEDEEEDLIPIYCIARRREFVETESIPTGWDGDKALWCFLIDFFAE